MRYVIGTPTIFLWSCWNLQMSDFLLNSTSLHKVSKVSNGPSTQANRAFNATSIVKPARTIRETFKTQIRVTKNCGKWNVCRFLFTAPSLFHETDFYFSRTNDELWKVRHTKDITFAISALTRLDSVMDSLVHKTWTPEPDNQKSLYQNILRENIFRQNRLQNI